MCNHENFSSIVNVTRLLQNDLVTVSGFNADFLIKCTDCGTDFEFIGVEPGYSPFYPRISIDSKELRCPIKPTTGQLVFQSEDVKLN